MGIDGTLPLASPGGDREDDCSDDYRWRWDFLPSFACSIASLEEMQ